MKDTVIRSVKVRKVFDSVGRETIEIEVSTLGGIGRFSSPSGTSKGKYEVIDYPEGNIDEGVRRARELVIPKLIGLDSDSQEEIDLLLHEIDGTPNFSNIGGNVAYAISMAVAEAAANTHKIPLFRHLAKTPVKEIPLPLGNVISGGKHAGKNAPDIQEFLVLPMGVGSFIEAAKANIYASSVICSLLERSDIAFFLGRSLEGAWIADIDNEKALEIVSHACEALTSELGIETRPGIDVAASSIWNGEKGKYVYKRNEIERSPGEQIDFLMSLIEKYSLVYVEDPFHEESFEDFAELTRRSKDCFICGDDLFATDKRRLLEGIRVGAANSIIIKPNQVGTLTDAIKTADLAKEAGYVPIASHRSGESEHSHLVHVAIALRCPIVKVGILSGERTSKINELIRISELEGMKLARLAMPTSGKSLYEHPT